MNNVFKSLEYMTIGASIHDANGIVMYVNPVFCKFFKTSNKNIINNKLSIDNINVEIDSVFNVFEFINNNLSNINNLTFKIRFNDIGFKVIKSDSFMIKNGVDYYIVTYNDVTDSVSQSHLYQEIFNNVNVGIILLKSKNGQDFFIKDLNPFVENLENITKDNIIDKNINEITNNKIILDGIENVWKNGIKLELKNIKCDDCNKLSWRNVYIHKISSGDIVILYEDITRMIESKKKFEDFDKQKTTFLSNMSHEIRNPINSIIGFADLLSEENNKQKQLEYIDIIKTNGNMLTQLVNDILDITKIEEGKLDINKSEFNVNKIIEEIYTTTKSNISKDVEFKKNTPIHNLTLLNDEYRFRQILNNLISNSKKFTKTGSIEIGYKKENNFIVFYVKDTGIGIKDKDKEKVFNRFEQIKQSSKIGYGLGLPICVQLIKMMGGEIWFDSEYGVGSTFYFKLLIDKKIENKKQNININTKTDINLSGKTILLAEDIDFNIKLLLSYLEQTNVNIILAVDGNDTLIKYNDNKNTIDLILMDIQMPFMEGTEVTQIIRTIDKTTPIIAQTAYAMKEEIDNILECGFNDIIKKPIRKDELLRLISKYI